MSFFIPDYNDHDVVTFFIRPDYSDLPLLSATHYIKRGDDLCKRYYLKKYMDTNVKNKTFKNPAKLILEHLPKNYCPNN